MDAPPTGPSEPGTPPRPAGDRILGETPITTAPTFGPVAAVGENVMPVRDRVQWGPIFAGLFTAIATFLLMTVLGIAIGASVLDPADSGREIGTWAAVWGAISAIVAFFVGGWLAAKTAAVGGSFGGLVNGLMVGVAGLVLIMYLTGIGLGNLFGTISSNLGDIVNVVQEAAQMEGVTPEEAQGEAQEAVDEAQATLAEADTQETFDTIRDSAFGTFLGLLLPLVAAALGGYFGHNTRGELIYGTG